MIPHIKSIIRRRMSATPWFVSSKNAECPVALELLPGEELAGWCLTGTSEPEWVVFTTLGLRLPGVLVRFEEMRGYEPPPKRGAKGVHIETVSGRIWMPMEGVYETWFCDVWLLVPLLHWVTRLRRGV